jgi:hypothetical protein
MAIERARRRRETDLRVGESGEGASALTEEMKQ